MYISDIFHWCTYICIYYVGHAADGVYHHHTYPSCLAARLNDQGMSHSPIYGWMNDGFPVYGPYNGNGVLASPCWKKRDYSSTTTGCIGGQRTCQLNNQYDIRQGFKTVTLGPNIGATVISLSCNSITVNSGVYVEDYYYNASCYAVGGANLDYHNGHDHDGLGYHYHVTIDSTKKPIFPYIVGPKMYGCVGCLGGSAVCGLSAGTSASSAQCMQGASLAPSKVPTSIPMLNTISTPPTGHNFPLVNY